VRRYRGELHHVRDRVSQNRRAVNIAVGGQYTPPLFRTGLIRRGKPPQPSHVGPAAFHTVPDAGRRACGRQSRGSQSHPISATFGKLDGQISEITAGGFLLELAMTLSKREKLANKTHLA